ncbi:uncharacterized protein N0V89_007210 [Didymosphaeria variabile]|uniref:DUF7492 domain-containing protein n=1 Tax=Didymosphaeria variabile TaxID=1932322 RepID=A0A9W9CAL1_9PLEO|nr:uncharacterized protein N0V89_007210 [Didymosphaeria variabile]KAJ4351866.1 hypothetical protein N0V89_007210 [Didymosphaeria variabile]
MRYTTIAAAAALACAPFTAAHSWVQQLRNVNNNGSYVGNWGYPRGYCAKGDSCDPGIINNFLIPATGLFIDDSNVLCKDSQQKAVQEDAVKYPRLQAVPGMHIALRYSENGHVSLNGTPQEDTNKFKPSKGGTVFIYGTTEPKEDEKLVNVLKWNKEGGGGDGRGVLLGTNDFDDGRCYENNNSPIAKARAALDPSYALGQTGEGNGEFGLPCESNIEFPKNATAGKPYTLYWVWQWNTPPGLDPNRPLGKDEYYTSCMDVDVVDTFSAEANAKPKYTTPQQDDASAAVKDFADRTAIYTNAIKGEIGPYFSKNQTTPGGLPASGTPSIPMTPGPTDIPPMSSRPGLPQPSQGASDGSGNIGNGNGGVVTVTDVVYVTVTAPNNGPTTLATVAIPTSEAAPQNSSGVQSVGNAPNPTGIPQLSQRPGRQPQATVNAAPFRGRLRRA